MLGHVVHSSSVVHTGNVLHYIHTDEEDSHYTEPGSVFCGRQCVKYIPIMKNVTMPSQVVAEVIFDPGDWSHVYAYSRVCGLGVSLSYMEAQVVVYPGVFSHVYA